MVFFLFFYHSFLVGVPETERYEVDVVGLLLVDGPGLDGLGQELVDTVGWLQGLALLPLSPQLEAFRDLQLEKKELRHQQQKQREETKKEISLTNTAIENVRVFYRRRGGLYPQVRHFLFSPSFFSEDSP